MGATGSNGCHRVSGAPPHAAADMTGLLRDKDIIMAGSIQATYQHKESSWGRTADEGREDKGTRTV